MKHNECGHIVRIGYTDARSGVIIADGAVTTFELLASTHGVTSETVRIVRPSRIDYDYDSPPQN